MTWTPLKEVPLRGVKKPPSTSPVLRWVGQGKAVRAETRWDPVANEYHVTLIGPDGYKTTVSTPWPEGSSPSNRVDDAVRAVVNAVAFCATPPQKFPVPLTYDGDGTRIKVWRPAR